MTVPLAWACSSDRSTKGGGELTQGAVVTVARWLEDVAGSQLDA
jgi:hypothetical protein